MEDENKKIKLEKSQALILEYTRDDIGYFLSVLKGSLRKDILFAMAKAERLNDVYDLTIRLDILIRKKETLDALFTDDILNQNPALVDLEFLVCFSKLVDWCIDYAKKRLSPDAEKDLYRDSFFPGWRMVDVCGKLIKELFAKFN